MVIAVLNVSVFEKTQARIPELLGFTEPLTGLRHLGIITNADTTIKITKKILLAERIRIK